MIDELIKKYEDIIRKNKKIMEECKDKIDNLTKYELNELLELETKLAFHKGLYMSDTRTLDNLKQLKEHENDLTCVDVI